MSGASLSASQHGGTVNASTGILENVWSGLKSFFETELGKVEDTVKVDLAALETRAVADIKQVFSVGAPMAVEAVANLVQDETTPGGEKFSTAVTDVTQQLEAKIGPVLVQDVGALVQMVVRFGPGIAASLL